jgi:hypothetical protein
MGNELNVNEEKKSVEMNLSELRRAICGDMQFIIELGNGIELSVKELNQTELNVIDGILFKRNVNPQKNYKEYENILKVLKLTHAYISLSINGKTIELKNDSNVVIKTDEEKLEAVEKLMWGLGEGVISGLSIQYDNVLIEKFSSIKKKVI